MEWSDLNNILEECRIVSQNATSGVSDKNYESSSLLHCVGLFSPCITFTPVARSSSILGFNSVIKQSISQTCSQNILLFAFWLYKFGPHCSKRISY